MQRLVQALLPHRGAGLHLRIVGHSTNGGNFKILAIPQLGWSTNRKFHVAGIALLIMLELLLAHPLGLGGHAGSLREGFQSIRAMGFGAPLVIASLPPPVLPDPKPSAVVDANAPTSKPPIGASKSSSSSNDSSGGRGGSGTDSIERDAQSSQWPPRPTRSSSSLPASGSSGGGDAHVGDEFDVDAPAPDFSGLAVGRERSFSGSFNLGADASLMTAGWRARLIGNSQRNPDAWGSGLARAVASVPPPSSWVRAMTGATDEGVIEPSSATLDSQKHAGEGRTAGLQYEERAVPPLPGAVASAGTHFDLFCHQYDVVPRLFGPGNGDATADALHLLLPRSGIGGSGSTQEECPAPPDNMKDRLRREKTASSMAAYGLLGSAHMMFSLPEEECFDEWKDSSDDEHTEDPTKSTLPHVLRVAAEQQGSAQRCWCVTVATGDEERWLRLPPLPYLRHGAEVRVHSYCKFSDSAACVPVPGCLQRHSPCVC